MLQKVMVTTKDQCRKYRTMALRVYIECGFAEIFNLRCPITVYKTKQFVVCRNFRVISMRFAVFLCFSVHCLHVFLCII